MSTTIPFLKDADGRITECVVINSCANFSLIIIYKSGLFILVARLTVIIQADLCTGYALLLITPNLNYEVDKYHFAHGRTEKLNRFFKAILKGNRLD